MLFNSYVFIFLFLPIVWVVYFGLNKLNYYKVANFFLVLASLFFYGFNNWKFVFVLVGSIIVNYWLHIGFFGLYKGRKILLLLGIIFNLGLLFYFKYLNFFIENLNFVFGHSFVLKNIVLPLGISFYTFQQVSFLIDSYKNRMEKYSFDEYALFVSFFPQLIAGPIVLHSEMIPQFREKSKRIINYDNIYDGIQYFVLGLAKKVILADSFGRAVDWGYENVLELNGLTATFVVLFYTLQIYFDFSGYCDMAIGIAKLFNIDIAVNFDSPYKALSVNEFWKRWHITLTRFFTTYVYIPLGGNKKGHKRTYINVLIVFLLSGFWHGADWTFVIWGILHGIMMVFERMFSRYLEKIPKIIRWLVTFSFINCAWVFFRADFLGQALSMFKRILVGGAGKVSAEMVDVIMGNSGELLFGQLGISWGAGDWVNRIVIWTLVAIVLLVTILGKNVNELVLKKNHNKVYRLGIVCVMLLAVISISSVSEFLYFNF